MPFSFIIPFVAAAKAGAHSYHPLPAPDDETLLPSPESEEARILPFKYSLILDSSFWLTASAVLSVAVTIWNLLVIQQCLQEPHVTYLEASIGSPYNGLGRLVRNESSPSWPLSSIHYPDFMAATDGTYVRHALNNGSIVRLDSEVCISVVPEMPFTHLCLPDPAAHNHHTASRSRLRPRALHGQIDGFSFDRKRARAHRTGIRACWGEAISHPVAFRRHGKQGSACLFRTSGVSVLAERTPWRHDP